MGNLQIIPLPPNFTSTFPISGIFMNPQYPWLNGGPSFKHICYVHAEKHTIKNLVCKDYISAPKKTVLLKFGTVIN